ncbi:putative Dynein light chain type 1 [Paratrimastix pyriformis]|uniref:Dynein light chain n=1 Tax=Paratrimastix pyriformis TaxID=342808 RepID=A0ABQ8USB7_9EUKA|nr:putative Dynein light chain type 1 [Paratrimastix pyriformis]
MSSPVPTATAGTPPAITPQPTAPASTDPPATTLPSSSPSPVPPTTSATVPAAAQPTPSPEPSVSAAPAEQILSYISIKGHDFSTKNTDMPYDLWHFVLTSTAEIFDTVSNERDLAVSLKKKMDEQRGLLWHCAVGSSFAANVSHEQRHFIYFYCDSTALLLWKSG